MARLAEYLRRSSPGEEAATYSIGDQQLEVAKWNATQRQDIVKSYSDPGGKSWTLNRPVLRQLFADAKSGLFDTVVVARWDRLSRIQVQQAVIIHSLEQYNVNVVSATEPSFDGPMGTFVRNTYAFAAELQLMQIRELTLSGKKARLRSGKLPAAPYPLYGYLYADPNDGKTRFIPDPETARVVRYIFQLVADGVKIRAIGRRLDSEHIPTPSQILFERGQLPRNKTVAPKWHTGTIQRYLRETGYIGQYVGWRRGTESVEVEHEITHEMETKVRQVKRAEDDPDRIILGPDVCPPIVDEVLFRQVQAILDRNQAEAYRNTKDPEAGLLRYGIASCGYCGRRMSLKFSVADNHYRYCCASFSKTPCAGGRYSRRANALDDLVWRWILHQFEHPDVLRMKYEVWKAERDEGRTIEHDRLADLERLMAKTEQRKRNCQASAMDSENEEDRAEWTLKANEAAKQLRELTRDYDELSAILGRQDATDGAVDSLVTAGPRALAQLHMADFESKRTVLHALAVKVTCYTKVDPRDMEISWALGGTYALWAQSRGIDCVANDKCMRSV
jgi:DNA invertase Pin-like site-specific DNA recombinase